MPLASGTRVGPYEILSSLGAGGMGEVYRARDTKLAREVAVKLLLPAIATSPDHLARFAREAQVLASLNHHNIARIYGIEETEGAQALIMELVDGQTLDERIAQGPIPLGEALPIARQIAEALEAAHDQGVVHRDLKPANIKLGPNGAVKVLDFGLAKVVEPPGTSPGSESVTAQALTGHGVILGTTAYMSPEQAEGKPVDARSDLWAFGVVLLEMLTGERVFKGESLTQVLAAVLRAEPEWSRLPPDTPASIRRLLQRCLVKDRRRRLSSAADARLEIDDALNGPAGEEKPAAAAVAPRRWRHVLFVAVPLGVLLAIGAALALRIGLRRNSSTVPVRFAIVPPSTFPLVVSGTDRDLALSSDGTRLVYTAGARRQLVVRAFDRFDAIPMSGVTGVRAPFLSPDGRWIGYFTGVSGELKKVSIAGGIPVSLCRYTGSPRGATWGSDDRIVFATNEPKTGLFRVAASGGEAVMLTRPDATRGMEEDHLFPSALPGGKAVLFTVAPISAGAASAQVAVLDLESGKRRTLIRGGSGAVYVEGGHLIYGSGDGLRAVRFDPVKLEVIGEPVPVLEGVMIADDGAANFSVAQNGTLAYVPAAAQSGSVAPRSLVWVDRRGGQEKIAAPPHLYAGPRISPDGTRVAMANEGEEQDIWIWSFARQALTRLTFDPARDFYPGWTRDGRSILFMSARSGVPHLYRRPADGTGADEQLTSGQNVQYGSPSMSPDGTRVVFTEVVPETGEDIMMLTLDGARRVEPLLHSRFAERNPAISPDGRWIAYESNESGQEEIYVRPFPNVGDGHWEVSAGGGTAPRWASNGKELFYRDLNTVMAAPVQAVPTFSAGTPAKVVDGPYMTSLGGSYDVSPDGQRFLMIEEGGSRDGASATIAVVLNWFEELKRKLPPAG